MMKKSFAFVVFALLACGFSVVAGNFKLVDSEKNHTQILVGDQASEEVVKIADQMSAYAEKVTGKKLQINREKDHSPAWNQKIYLGDTEKGKAFSDLIAGRGPDAFAITFPDENSMVIVGANDRALRYALLYFAEKYLGLGFLLPGEDGTYIPKREAVEIPMTTVVESPAIESRLLSFGVSSPAIEEIRSWATLRNMDSKIYFHHNLNNIFKPSVFGQSNPEFYPLVNGKRLIPTADTDDVSWQPCFTAPGSAEAAAKVICDFFEKHPMENSFSLGVNDSYAHCTCQNCMNLDGTTPNSVGIRSASQSYYTWCNKVAGLVREKFPEKFFGLLAYDGVLDPPNFKLDDHLIPYITLDRYMWLDSRRSATGKHFQQAWKDKAAVLGWYEYIYGNAYVPARHYPHLLAENLRYGVANNVRDFYAEIYPSTDWHEGPMYYLLLKLLWNPNLDVDAELNDWCRMAVGEQAAPMLMEYYQLWEKFWMEDVPKSDWFTKHGVYVFMVFTSKAYLEQFDPAILQKADALMAQVVEKAEFKKRAVKLQEAYLKRRGEIMTYAENARINRQKYRRVENIRKNDFVKDMEGWDYWQRSSSFGKFEYLKNGGRNRSGALVIEPAGSKKQPMCFICTIPLKTGTVYEISVFCKLENIPADGKIALAVKWKKDAEWLDELYTVKAFPDMNNRNYQQLKVYVTPPAGFGDDLNCSIALECDNLDQGRIFWDDFSIGKAIK